MLKRLLQAQTPQAQSKYIAPLVFILTVKVFFMVEISRLFWKKVYTTDGFLVGETENAELDRTTWQITNFYISLTDEAAKLMELKHPFMGKVMVCLPVTLINAIDDSVLLNKTKLELQNLKQCKE
jgi:sporulation protein YlmC with PRC-barrel domain